MLRREDVISVLDQIGPITPSAIKLNLLEENTFNSGISKYKEYEFDRRKTNTNSNSNPFIIDNRKSELIDEDKNSVKSYQLSRKLDYVLTSLFF